jgi:hypothetical protein
MQAACAACARRVRCFAGTCQTRPHAPARLCQPAPPHPARGSVRPQPRSRSATHLVRTARARRPASGTRRQASPRAARWAPRSMLQARMQHPMTHRWRAGQTTQARARMLGAAALPMPAVPWSPPMGPLCAAWPDPPARPPSPSPPSSLLPPSLLRPACCLPPSLPPPSSLPSNMHAATWPPDATAAESLMRAPSIYILSGAVQSHAVATERQRTQVRTAAGAPSISPDTACAVRVARQASPQPAERTAPAELCVHACGCCKHTVRRQGEKTC